MTRKQIILGAYLGGVNHHTLWALPDSGSQIDFSTFRHVAQTAERGKFDLFFLAEGLILRERLRQVFDQDVVGRPDTLAVLAAIAAVTTHLGVVGTLNATSRSGAPNANISKLVSLLLSGEVDGRLEPLRLTLGLEGENFREGIFSWKGFLYYKWVLNSLWPELRGVIHELTEIKVVGPRDYEMLSQVKDVGARVNQAILGQVRKVRTTLQVYDDAFNQLTQASNPTAFRDFLLKSPEMFITLGERTGMVSHIASFWRYRFPKGRPLMVELDELFDILQDFHQGLGEDEDKAVPAAVVGDSALIDPANAEAIGKAV